ncbi:MAG: hypothetical protein ACLQBJ_16410 [Bryobacteraceae bacterium]
MEELGKDAPEAASGADESELNQQELDDVTGGTNAGGNSGGPIGPVH